MLQMENNYISSLAHFPAVAGIFFPINVSAKALPKLILNISVRTNGSLWAVTPHTIWCTKLEKSKVFIDSILSCLCVLWLDFVFYNLALVFVIFCARSGPFSFFCTTLTNYYFAWQLTMLSRRSSFQISLIVAFHLYFLACRRKSSSSEVSNANYSTSINM